VQNTSDYGGKLHLKEARKISVFGEKICRLLMNGRVIIPWMREIRPFGFLCPPWFLSLLRVLRCGWRIHPLLVSIYAKPQKNRIFKTSKIPQTTKGMFVFVLIIGKTIFLLFHSRNRNPMSRIPAIG
jgi:hypothetical protein